MGIQVAVVGLGNVGRGAVEALLTAEDMTLAGVVRRGGGPDRASGENSPGHGGGLGRLAGAAYPVVGRVEDLPVRPAAVILCAPSRVVPGMAEEYLKKGFVTVDSFDIHREIWEVRCRLDRVARAHGTVAVTAAGWDPGSDSVIRALLEACAPRGITYTNFGPGMSMGHTTAVKGMAGVADALSLTLPLGAGRHSREVYVKCEPGADFQTVAAKIKGDAYFINDATTVMEVEEVTPLLDRGHGVELVRKGVSGMTHGQRFGFSMAIENPALTGQLLVSATRAALRQSPGCYTLPELPPLHLLAGEMEGLIRRIV